ncbi:receptor-interacting serine/threonine-protein kinase 3-like [Thalassophryne amazonica]|uniref:receptor-interacting serine/threonine-protein kinase 3-like n=1 Tax=Thalassophryne amazonica TaxID=390379 RepID=UPI001471F448|nr:receptor-interacting serine/threonine-protein kinase 3-like [Thalassophryne amazonica]
MAQRRHNTYKTLPVGDDSLRNWSVAGHGGFGYVYKARHKDWGFDVAIKLLRDGVGSIPKDQALWKEANHMDDVSCEFVLRVYGMYQGCPPGSGFSSQQGIVMEYMNRGSIQTLLTDLSGPPPWPLVFRLAHQVALGMNFLHSRNLLHQDLKPSNVLLNDDLNAKIADFGLARISASALNNSSEIIGEKGGSYKYMPPEAFSLSYEPVRAADRYSYGVLLWSIISGKEPYQGADYSIVALRIPRGDRPNCEEIEQLKADGLQEVVVLMKSCWDQNPSKRPVFKDCLVITESVFSRHKKDIPIAVHQVLTKLESPVIDELMISTASNIPFQETEQSAMNDSVDAIFAESQSSSKQVPVNVVTHKICDEEKAKFVDDKRATLIQDISNVMAITEELGRMVYPEVYSMIEAEKIRQTKVRLLFNNTLHSGGVKVKAAFFDALKKHEPYLVERLGG